mgnify:CR=1 FL=1
MAPEIDEIIRSRRRTIALIVEPSGRVIVRAPLHAPLGLINKFVSGKQDWIDKHRQIMAAKPQKPKVQFASGESFLLRGKKITLLIDQNAKQALSLEGQCFRLRIDSQPHAARLFEALYKTIARRYFEGRLVGLATALGYKYTTFRLSSAATRWGSCSTRGTISLTWRLVMAPDDVIDYVIVHELVHTKVHNHSSLFWLTVEKHMPNYKTHRDWLKKNGHLLQLDR